MRSAHEGVRFDGVACSVRRTTKPGKGDLEQLCRLRGLQDFPTAEPVPQRRTGSCRACAVCKLLRLLASDQILRLSSQQFKSAWLTFFARNLARNGDDGEDDVRGGATARVPADREATVSSVGTPTLARRSELRRPLAAVKPRGQRGGQSQAARMLAQTGGRCWTSEWDPSPHGSPLQ